MSRSTVYKRCSLCFTKFEPDGGELIWKDSMQLCPKCYVNKFYQMLQKTNWKI